MTETTTTKQTRLLIVVDQTGFVEVYKDGPGDVLVKSTVKRRNQSEESFEKSLGWAWANEVHSVGNLRLAISAAVSPTVEEIADQLDSVRDRYGWLSEDSIDYLLRLQAACRYRCTLLDVAQLIMKVEAIGGVDKEKTI